MDELKKHSQIATVVPVVVPVAVPVIVPAPVENRIAGVLQSSDSDATLHGPFEALTEELASSPEDYAPAKALQALEAGDAEKALAICDSTQSTSLSLPLIRGRALLALQRASEAAEEFHRVLREDPECPAALKGLGDSHFAQNKEIIAFTYYERARELSGDYQALVERVHYSLDDTSVETNSESVTIPVSEESEAIDEAQSPIEDIIVSEEVLEEILEEIVVRDSDEDVSGEKMNVSLTLKRGSEEPTPVETKTIAVTEPKIVEKPEKSVRPERPERPEREAPIELPAKLTERYDRPQRPEHYQTETMADLLLQQGYPDAALEIFRVLIAKNPLPRLREKLAKAESRQKRSR